MRQKLRFLPQPFIRLSEVNVLTVKNKSLGIYIHIPFCDGKCNYCDFYSFKAAEDVMDTYVDNLIDIIQNWSKKLSDKIVDTIYFGGGTPSVLGTERLVKTIENILSFFKIAPKCEITLEANPTSAGRINFAELKSAGFNRVSLGMQSSNDNELKLLGRRHTNADVISTVNSIRNSGIDNISLDVMLGIPEQSLESLKETLDFCISQDVAHISTYLLTIEPDTIFGRERHKYNFADEDMQAEFYTFTNKYLKQQGFTHYEISNFCKDNMYSRHNMRYWQLKDYLGLGPSAHSCINGKRFYYPKNMDDFTSDKIIDDGVGGTAEEYIMLMLRTKDGVNPESYKKLFGKLPDIKFFTKVSQYKKYGYIEEDDNSIRLTEKGFLFSNTVIADLI